MRPIVSPTNVVEWPAVVSADSEHEEAMQVTGSRWVYTTRASG